MKSAGLFFQFASGFSEKSYQNTSTVKQTPLYENIFVFSNNSCFICGKHKVWYIGLGYIAWIQKLKLQIYHRMLFSFYT